MKARHLLSLGILHDSLQHEAALPAVLVSHLRLNMYRGLATRNVEIGGIDIRTRRTQIGIEGQRLVQLIGDVQEHILGNTAIVGIEVAVVPLIAAVMLPRAVLPAVVAAHRQHVLPIYYIRCQVEARCHHSVLAVTQIVTVQVENSPLAHTLKLDENLTVCHIGQREMLAIPHHGICQVYDILAERLVAVEGIGQRHLLPVAVIVGRHHCLFCITHRQQPLAVEIQFLTLCSLCRCNKQHTHQKQHCESKLF